MGQEQPVALDVDGGRVGHEGDLPGQGEQQEHGECRRDIAFAAADHSLVVEP